MKKRKKDAPVERVETPSFTDPQGSWTGVPLDPFEEPVQDADELLAVTQVEADGRLLEEVEILFHDAAVVLLLGLGAGLGAGADERG